MNKKYNTTPYRAKAREGPIHPRVCTHAYSMLYDDDFCCCRRCEQAWEKNEYNKMIPLVNGKPFIAQRKTWTR